VKGKAARHLRHRRVLPPSRFEFHVSHFTFHVSRLCIPMSRRTRIFLGIFAVYLAAVAFLLYRVTADLDPRYRESAEESLVDTANLLATLLERNTFNGVIPTDELERTLAHLSRRPVYAKIFGVEKTRVDLHVYVTDRNGIVLFDSRGQDVGADYLAWRDVQLTLTGAYGARTTLADEGDPASAVMYVGAAIRERDGSRKLDANILAGEDIVGMVSVGKPVAAFAPFIQGARQKLFAVGAISVGAFALLLLIATLWLVRPFGLLRDVWVAVRREGGSPIALARRIAHALRTAFAEARDTLAGRSYVDEYVQTLAHELKSPLAAIRGAAELMREPAMPEDARAKFADNIDEQTRRAQAMIDRLLELSNLERRGALDEVEEVDLSALAGAVRDELAPLADTREIAIALDIPPRAPVRGDAFLLHRALANLVRNAIDFAPTCSTIEVGLTQERSRWRLTVRDGGPGLPDYAVGRVFDRFYSLPRPHSGRKSTGLGLAFVKEVAALHGGSIALANHPEGGALATLTLPRERGFGERR
jgi:two-component system sensor histidine kinase CreC